MNVGPEGEPVAREEKVAPVVEGIEPGATQPCEKCSKDMVVRTSRRGAFWGCTGFPKCRNTIAIEGAQAEPQVEETEHKCPNCQKPLAQRRGRFGPFLGCTGYPECKTIVNLDKEGNPRWPVADAAADGAVADGATNGTSKNGAATAASGTKKAAATRGKKTAATAKKATAKKPAAREEAMVEVA
jgi:DNA topoisomerase-1